MICLGYNKDADAFCDSEQFLPGERVVSQYWRSKKLKVKAPVMICIHCGWFTIGNDQTDELLKRTKIAYDKRLKKEQRKADMVDH